MRITSEKQYEVHLRYTWSSLRLFHMAPLCGFQTHPIGPRMVSGKSLDAFEVAMTAHEGEIDIAESVNQADNVQW